jgi:hypothetical protein
METTGNGVAASYNNHPTLYPGYDTNSFHLNALTRIANRRSLIILAFSIGSGVILACYMYNINNHSLLYYSDSISHLVRARQLIDYSSPGLEQIGTVWLPLPHLILLPFSLVDLLFETGFAGTFVSLPSLAIASAIIYKIIKVQTDISWIAILGSCLFFLNPNILYLGITAMTEALFMLFFIVASLYFQRIVLSGMYSTKQEHSDVSSIDIKDSIVRFRRLKIVGPEHNSMISDNLLKCSFFIALATLCRYEAWPIPVLITLFIIKQSMKAKANGIDRGLEARVSYRKRLMGGLVCIALSFSGIILWVSYNWIYFNSPLEFVISPYYSAAAQALEGQNRDLLFLQPLTVVSIYGVNALVFFGPVTIVGATFGYIIHRMSKPLENRRGILVFLFSGIPTLFSLFTLVFGIGEMNYWWFNSRFVIVLAPLLILLLSFLLKRINDRILNNSILVYISFVIFLIYPLIILPVSGQTVTLVDAKNSMSYGTRPFAMDLANVLGRLYDGGKIFIIAGSAQQNIIMQASGIPLTNFYAASEQFKTHHQLQQVEHDSHYVILSKAPDADSQDYFNFWTKRQGELRKYFDKAYENPFYVLFVPN